ncbi:hypothetical protein GEMRC1_010067 [Eukaryota sp. GEM-RC1]
MDFTTVYPCNSTSVNKIVDENYSALETAERQKLNRYGELISKMSSCRHNPFVFHPFAISLYGTFGCFGQQFLTDFGKLCKHLRDQCLELFESNGFHGIIKPVLNTLSDSIMIDKSRGDLIGPWLSSQEVIMDLTTVDPCNSTSVNK